MPTGATPPLHLPFLPAMTALSSSRYMAAGIGICLTATSELQTICVGGGCHLACMTSRQLLLATRNLLDLYIHGHHAAYQNSNICCSVAALTCSQRLAWPAQSFTVAGLISSCMGNATAVPSRGSLRAILSASDDTHQCISAACALHQEMLPESLADVLSLLMCHQGRGCALGCVRQGGFISATGQLRAERRPAEQCIHR